MQSSTRQPQSAQLFANSYSGMARNRSSDALGAGGQHRPHHSLSPLLAWKPLNLCLLSRQYAGFASLSAALTMQKAAGYQELRRTKH